MILGFSWSEKSPKNRFFRENPKYRKMPGSQKKIVFGQQKKHAFQVLPHAEHRGEGTFKI
jgi:hypothetical protein